MLSHCRLLPRSMNALDKIQKLLAAEIRNAALSYVSVADPQTPDADSQGIIHDENHVFEVLPPPLLTLRCSAFGLNLHLHHEAAKSCMNCFDHARMPTAAQRSALPVWTWVSMWVHLSRTHPPPRRLHRFSAASRARISCSRWTGPFAWRTRRPAPSRYCNYPPRHLSCELRATAALQLRIHCGAGSLVGGCCDLEESHRADQQIHPACSHAVCST